MAILNRSFSLNAEQKGLPKLLLVTRNLPPLIGGMERLNWHMADELASHYTVRVVGPVGSGKLAPPSVDVLECPHRPLWRFLLASAWSAIREAIRFKPQIILAGSGLSAPIVWLAARLVKAKSAVYVHGLDVAVRHPIYRLAWLPSICRLDYVIANSHATRKLALSIGVKPNKICIVHPGVSLPERLPSSYEIADFRNRHQLGDRPILLSVGRLTARKGLREFVELALPIIVAKVPNLLLVVIGDVATEALKADKQSPESIITKAKTLGLQDNIRFIGNFTEWSELSKAYSAADVHVFPVRELEGDPEGFGMVAIEAAAHGLPTVAFATGGVTDAVKDTFSGLLILPNDYQALADATLKILTMSKAYSATAIEFSASFAWHLFGQEIFTTLSSLHPQYDYRDESL